MKTTLNKHRRVCTNAKFDVFLDDVRLSGGRRVRNFLVIHPKLKRKRLVVGVAILPVSDRAFGLVKVYRHALKAQMWEIPRGFIEKGETERQAAIRELEEEMQIVCSPKHLFSLGYLAPEPGIVAARIHLFVAFVERPKRLFKPTEFGHTRIRFFTTSQLFQSMRCFRFEDPCTLVAFYRYHQAFAKGRDPVAIRETFP